MSKRIVSDAERAEYRDGKRAEQRALVEAACREMLSSDGWRRFAETRATFHRYSFGNCMLIAHQMPALRRSQGSSRGRSSAARPQGRAVDSHPGADEREGTRRGRR
jgi:hypothetical protein